MNSSTAEALEDSALFGRGVYRSFIDEFEKVAVVMPPDLLARLEAARLTRFATSVGRVAPKSKPLVESAAKDLQAFAVGDKVRAARAAAKAGPPVPSSSAIPRPTPAEPTRRERLVQWFKSRGTKAATPTPTPGQQRAVLPPSSPENQAVAQQRLNRARGRFSSDIDAEDFNAKARAKAATPPAPATPAAVPQAPTPAAVSGTPKTYRIKKPKGGFPSLKQPGLDWKQVGAGAAAGAGGMMLLNSLGQEKAAEAAHEAGESDPAAETEIERVAPVHEFIGVKPQVLGAGKAKGIPVISPPPGYVYDPVLQAMAPDMEDPGWSGAPEAMLLRSDAAAQGGAGDQPGQGGMPGQPTVQAAQMAQAPAGPRPMSGPPKAPKTPASVSGAPPAGKGR